MGNGKSIFEPFDIPMVLLHKENQPSHIVSYVGTDPYLSCDFVQNIVETTEEGLGGPDKKLRHDLKSMCSDMDIHKDNGVINQIDVKMATDINHQNSDVETTTRIGFSSRVGKVEWAYPGMLFEYWCTSKKVQMTGIETNPNTNVSCVKISGEKTTRKKYKDEISGDVLLKYFETTDGEEHNVFKVDDKVCVPCSYIDHAKYPHSELFSKLRKECDEHIY